MKGQCDCCHHRLHQTDMSLIKLYPVHFTPFLQIVHGNRNKSECIISSTCDLGLNVKRAKKAFPLYMKQPNLKKMIIKLEL